MRGGRCESDELRLKYEGTIMAKMLTSFERCNYVQDTDENIIKEQNKIWIKENGLQSVYPVKRKWEEALFH